mgnify:CR=1 FL=1
MMHKAKLLLDMQSRLGEGPVWDWQKQLLFWVDIEGKKLHQYNSSVRKHTEWSFDEMIGAAAPMKNGHFLLALESGLASFELDAKKLTKLHVLENSNTAIRFNDGKVGPDGNFWVGTMDKNCAAEAGNFYRIASNLTSALQLSETSVSNGLAWSADKKTFFYIDSPTFTVRAFDFDMESGSIANGKVIIDVPEAYGSPDGMSIDAEGMLWIAHWGGNCVRRWNPETGEVLQKVEVAAPHVTSCCFGGKNLDILYITTARSGLTETHLEEFPESGGLFVFEPNVKGTPITYFKKN